MSDRDLEQEVDELYCKAELIAYTQLRLKQIAQTLNHERRRDNKQDDYYIHSIVESIAHLNLTYLIDDQQNARGWQKGTVAAVRSLIPDPDKQQRKPATIDPYSLTALNEEFGVDAPYSMAALNRHDLTRLRGADRFKSSYIGRHFHTALDGDLDRDIIIEGLQLIEKLANEALKYPAIAGKDIKDITDCMTDKKPEAQQKLEAREKREYIRQNRARKNKNLAGGLVAFTGLGLISWGWNVRQIEDTAPPRPAQVRHYALVPLMTSDTVLNLNAYLQGRAVLDPQQQNWVNQALNAPDSESRTVILQRINSLPGGIKYKNAIFGVLLYEGQKNQFDDKAQGLLNDLAVQFPQVRNLHFTDAYSQNIPLSKMQHDGITIKPISAPDAQDMNLSPLSSDLRDIIDEHKKASDRYHHHRHHHDQDPHRR